MPSRHSFERTGSGVMVQDSTVWWESSAGCAQAARRAAARDRNAEPQRTTRPALSASAARLHERRAALGRDFERTGLAAVSLGLGARRRRRRLLAADAVHRDRRQF